MHANTQSLKRLVRNIRNSFLALGRTKYFCIGFNKTGTTSVKQAFSNLGFVLGDQPTAERLYVKYYFNKDFGPIIKYCRTAQVFQDIPFSCPETFKYLDIAYPNSKFILTVRDDPDQWYRSLTRFHAKIWGANGRVPTAEDLKNAEYRCKELPYYMLKLYGTTDAEPYAKAILTQRYREHNQEVVDYFSARPRDLLVINLSDPTAYSRFASFLDVDSPYDAFPWENRT